MDEQAVGRPSVECWRDEDGFHVRLPGAEAAMAPVPRFDDAAKAAIAAGVPMPFSWTFLDARKAMPAFRATRRAA